MKIKTLILGILLVVTISNLPIWSSITHENYCYRNVDGSYTVCEQYGKGSSFIKCIQHYGFFLATHPEKDQGDNKLYRTFKIQPWQFWQWREYIFHSERFTLPYLNTGQESQKHL